MRIALAALLAVAWLGCGDAVKAPPVVPATVQGGPSRGFPATFVDVTKEAGISFRHVNRSRGRKLLPETMGAGVAVADVDGDGVTDLVFAGGGDLGVEVPVFLGSRGGLRFREAPGPRFRFDDDAWPMGVSVTDADGDGRDDVYVTGTTRNALLVGGVVDVAAKAGVSGGSWRDTAGKERPAWSTASLWCDYDVDGDLDLFVAGYVQWTEDSDIFTSLDGVTKAFTTPDRYVGLPVRLYRNDGALTFRDVTEPAGLLPHLGKALGLATWDFDANGFPDVVVANDTRPNFLFVNRGDGTFREEGLAMRVAYDEGGRARAGMGVDVADYGNDGVAGIAIGNFAGEPMSLYRASRGAFASVAEQAGLAAASTPLLAFGVAFADMDLDGALDIVVVNGHIEPDIARHAKEQTHAQRALLFLGRGDGTFADATASAGPDFGKPRVGRGLAIADLDGDGDLDIVVTENGGPATVLENRLMETAPAHWLRVALRGSGANTRGIGALVTVVAGGRRQTRLVHTGSSYLSQGDVHPTFGLGATTHVEELRVRWPHGPERVYPVDGVDRTITLVE